MLRRSCGLNLTHNVRSGLRIPRKERQFYRNSLYAKSRLIESRIFLRQFSSIPGSSFLRFQDPWLRWKFQSHLLSSSEYNDSQSNCSHTWIATSPASLTSRQPGILDRIRKWLRKCWRRISRLSFLAIRTGEVFIYLSPMIILVPSAFLTNRILKSSTVENMTWKYAIKAIQGLGPVAVKFCQWAATRRDIFPPSFCDHVAVLHDSGYPHSMRWTRQVLTEAFGDYERKGLRIGDVIGCGAAAQVYKGELTVEPDSTNAEKHHSTREVAIKVVHPRFQILVDRDLDFIQTVADFLHSLPIDYLKLLNLPRAVEEFSVLLRDQVDLTTEADNLREFGKNFRNNNSHGSKDVSSIMFPQPIDGWTSPDVIVEEYVADAVPIADFLDDSSQEGMDRRKELAAPLLRAFLKMVFVDNFIHGDLHPGNVLVKTTLVPKEPSSWSFFSVFEKNDGEQSEKENEIKRSIVFLDAGIVVSLSSNDKKNLFDLFRAVVFNDGNRAGRLMVERAKYERCSQSPGGKDRFAEGIENIVSEFHNHRKEGLTLGAVRIGGLLRRVLDLCRIHGVEIDPAMANVVISTLVLEGLGRSLSPDLDLLTFARPFLLS